MIDSQEYEVLCVFKSSAEVMGGKKVVTILKISKRKLKHFFLFSS
jgi:hypothetical protein